MLRIKLIVSLMFALVATAVGQNDTIIVTDNEVLVGTIKKMNRGILNLETKYSASDLRIEWDEIKQISTSSNFIISEKSGNRYYGILVSHGSDSIIIITDQEEKILINRNDLVYIDQVDEGFKDRFFLSIDIGFSMTQANNLMQWSSNSRIGYKAINWILEGRYSGIMSTQDETEAIYRWDRNLAFTYKLKRNWLINPEINFFSSTEQNLHLRIVPRLGVGKIIVNTHKIYWNATGGLNMNFEDFVGDNDDRRSVEAFVGTEFEIIDLNDLDFLGEFNVFPSLTESGRWRFDLSLDIMYDLPLGFYIKTGFDYNFDNKPTIGANGKDYLLSVGVGWEW